MGPPSGRPRASKTKVSTAEAFYRIFCALPKRDRFTVARYILQDEEVRKSFENNDMPNDITLRSFDENRSEMEKFGTIEALRQDLLS